LNQATAPAATDQTVASIGPSIMYTLLVQLRQPQSKLAEELSKLPKEELEAFRDKEGKTYLIIAAEQDDFAVVSALLQLGVDINHRDPRGRTALYYATLGGKFNSFNILLNNPARDVEQLTLIYNDLRSKPSEIVLTLPRYERAMYLSNTRQMLRMVYVLWRSM
jgi:ankyrin repeat protein